jgi:hypothetical protein
MGQHALEDMGTVIAGWAFRTECIDEDQEYRNAPGKIDDRRSD